MKEISGKLCVDIPKRGIGSSNDANTARKLFTKPKQAAGITNTAQ